jgi:hypothetical protein
MGKYIEFEMLAKYAVKKNGKMPRKMKKKVKKYFFTSFMEMKNASPKNAWQNMPVFYPNESYTGKGPRYII